MIRFIAFFLLHSILVNDLTAQHSIAREWNEQVLNAIRNDFARPTVHARNLFHTSVAMYDTWSVVTGNGSPYLLGDTLGNYVSTFPDSLSYALDAEEQDDYLDEAISHAIYNIMISRFQTSPGWPAIDASITSMMIEKGYKTNAAYDSYEIDPTPENLGYAVAQDVLSYGAQDGSRELTDYGNEFYQPRNAPLLVTSTGNDQLLYPNNWQPLAFDQFIDQSGNIILDNVPEFLGPEWGEVAPFALQSTDLNIYQDSLENNYYIYHDPGPPPYLGPDGMDTGSEDFRWGFSLVSIWSGMLDPSDGVMWDISPANIGNIESLPGNFEGYDDFYNFFNGGDASRGHDLNPTTNQPYETQMVPRADYARVLAEFWADGPDSETPPGHWFTILHEVMDHPLFSRRWQGTGGDLDQLEFDVKAFFTLGGAMHDAAVSTWGIKGWYDYARPVSVIRYMATKGQSTNPDLENYDPHGLPLIPGSIETIEMDDPLAINDTSLIGKIKMKAWRGPGFIQNPETDVAGVGWILAEGWWPYQRPTFVSPPFAGYTSGHSCFSRAAAEVLTMMTGDEFFPGGMGVFPISMNDFLVFEDGPSVDMELQWATYRDASDQTSLSRIWGGIHPPQDDIPGRIIGITIGIEAFNKANSYFEEENTSTYNESIVTDHYDIFPVPATQFDRIQIVQKGESKSAYVRVELYDMNSRRLRSEVIRTNRTSLDLRGLRSGQYVIHIIDGEERQISEIVVVN